MVKFESEYHEVWFIEEKIQFISISFSLVLKRWKAMIQWINERGFDPKEKLFENVLAHNLSITRKEDEED
jgi:hypothetical protein